MVLIRYAVSALSRAELSDTSVTLESSEMIETTTMSSTSVNPYFVFIAVALIYGVGRLSVDATAGASRMIVQRVPDGDKGEGVALLAIPSGHTAPLFLRG